MGIQVSETEQDGRFTRRSCPRQEPMNERCGREQVVRSSDLFRWRAVSGRLSSTRGEVARSANAGLAAEDWSDPRIGVTGAGAQRPRVECRAPCVQGGSMGAGWRRTQLSLENKQDSAAVAATRRVLFWPTKACTSCTCRPTQPRCYHFRGWHKWTASMSGRLALLRQGPEG